MHILLSVVISLILFYAFVRLAWRILVGKPKPKQLVAPEKFTPTRGKKGDDGIYQLTQAQFDRLKTAANEGLMFMEHQPREEDEPKIKEALVDQKASFTDLEAEGLLQIVPEKEYTNEIKKHIKDVNRPMRVMRLTDHAYKMFKSPSKETN